jgi:hypothetical protein
MSFSAFTKNIAQLAEVLMDELLRDSFAVSLRALEDNQPNLKCYHRGVVELFSMINLADEVDNEATSAEEAGNEAIGSHKKHAGTILEIGIATVAVVVIENFFRRSR